MEVFCVVIGIGSVLVLCWMSNFISVVDVVFFFWCCNMKEKVGRGKMMFVIWVVLE